jgi:predicted aldo/keto reductase-like oxidoreductase
MPPHRSGFLFTRFRTPHFTFDRPLCRLGLATRGDSRLTPLDVEHALAGGVNFLNWCGVPDALSRSISGLGPRRRRVMVCVQFEARTAGEAERELRQILHELHSDYVDVLTFYYVEERAEWEQIAGPGGALEFCRQARRDGKVRALGLTTHQRPLAADVARSGLLDLLMIRYNAAHRGAETEIFPVTQALGLPVVVYTCLRWGALLRGTPEDPAGLVVPSAPAWYRFALQNPAVTVALMAPETGAELVQDLTALDRNTRLTNEEYSALTAHGARVRKYAGSFP